MQPNNEQAGQVKSWGDFQARKLARAMEGGSDALSEALTQSISIVKKRKKRTPTPPVEAKEITLADVLKQAVEIAMTRRGRIVQEDSIREQTLLEVLTSAMRRAS